MPKKIVKSSSLWLSINTIKDLRNKFIEFEENFLYKNAAKSSNKHLTKRKKSLHKTIRLPFERDRHRIIFSEAFRAYRGKTQVFSLSNHYISDRMVHVNYVAQISRMIAKALDLNIDLTEAIAYAHDLGHPPFGHDGEKILSDICEKYGIGQFHHNIHGVRVVDEIEKNGKGLNLTFAVRDGIASHDGEVHNTKLIPQWDKSEEDLQKYMQEKTEGKPAVTFPATLEGCVVRICDTVAYLGTDIEDAIKLGIISRRELPKHVVKRLGNNNGKIIENIVMDIIKTSFRQDYISFSKEISDLILEQKKWNYENIYLRWLEKNDEKSKLLRKEKEKLKTAIWLLFESLLNDFEKGNEFSPIFKFFKSMSHTYKNKYEKTPPIIVRDFIASLTDSEAKDLINQLLVPKNIFESHF